MAPMTMKCVITTCGKRIHPERRAMNPKTKTCSARCSKRLHQEQQMEASRRYRARKNPKPPARREALAARDEKIMRELQAGSPVVEVASDFGLSARSIFRIRENNQ